MSVEFSLICLILPAFLLGLLFKLLGLFEVAGFIIGGVLSYHILRLAGIPIESALGYSEPFQSIGLSLFSFQIGASIRIQEVQRSAKLVVSTELILIAVSWLSSSLISRSMNFSGADRLVMFLLLINSSTFAVLAIERAGIRELKINEIIFRRTLLQTSLEDLLQFMLYGLFLSVPRLPYLVGDIEPLAYVFQVLGFIIVVYIVTKYAMKIFIERALKESRLKPLGQMDLFLMFVIVALIFSTLFSQLGLPGLIGSFIVGLVTAYYVDLSRVNELLRGVRDLGLLLYFSSIGAQIAPWILADLFLVAISFTFALLAILTRFIGLFLGFVFSGLDVKESTKTAVVLSSLSESTMIFTYVLYRDGLITPRLLITATYMTLVTIFVYPALLSKAELVSSFVSTMIPTNIIETINLFSRFYQRRISSLIGIMSTIALFVALSLAVLILPHLAIMIGLRGTILVFILLLSVILLLLIHAYSLRRLSIVLFEYIQDLSKELVSHRWGLQINPRSFDIVRFAKTLDKFIDVVMGVMGIALQVYLFYEYAYDYVFVYISEEHRIFTHLVVATSIFLIAYMGMRHYYGLKLPELFDFELMIDPSKSRVDRRIT